MNEPFDIAILGTGVTAGILAAILARQGLTVTLVGEDPITAPPQVAATIPFTSAVFGLLATRWDVPEIGHLTDTRTVVRHAGQGSGPQRVIGFAYHRDGAAHRSEESLQFTVPREHNESHLLGPEVAAYLLDTARRHGATTVFTDDPVEHDRTDRMVTLRAGSQQWTARMVVDTVGPPSLATDGDAAGSTSPGANGDAASSVPRIRRLAATFEGVRPYEDVGPTPKRFGPWSQGTLHHLFEGGWLGVLGHGGTRRRDRIVMNLDTAAHPEWGELPAEQLLASLAARFPSLQQHLDKAQLVSDWQDEDGPMVASQAVDERYLRIDRAAVSTDPLFAQPATFPAEVLTFLVPSLLEACAADDFSAERFGPVAAFQTNLAAHYETLRRCAYTAFRDFSLFNAFARVWLLGSMLAALTIEQRRKRFERTSDPEVLADLSTEAVHGCWFPVPAGYHDLFASTIAACDAAASGELSHAQAAERIYAAVRAADFVPPVFGFADPDDRCYRLSLSRQLRTLLWLARLAPPDIKALTAR